MQYPLPQFIDIEDKIFGPFTLKQFGFIFGGGLLVVAIFRVFQNSFIFWMLSLPIIMATLLIAFGKFNGRPVYSTFPIFIKFAMSTKQMVFSQKVVSLDDINIQPLETIKMAPKGPVEVEEPISTKLKRLSLLLDQKSQEETDTLDMPSISRAAQHVVSANGTTAAAPNSAPAISNISANGSARLLPNIRVKTAPPASATPITAQTAAPSAAATPAAAQAPAAVPPPAAKPAPPRTAPRRSSLAPSRMITPIPRKQPNEPNA